MPTYIERPDGTVRRYDDNGIVVIIPPDPQLADYQDFLTWRDQVTPNEEQLIADARAALATNAQLATQNQNIIDAAEAMRADMIITNYDSTGKTQVQVLGDLVQAVKILDSRTKQLAEGVKIMAQHDSAALQQVNYLIKLAVGELA